MKFYEVLTSFRPGPLFFSNLSSSPSFLAGFRLSFSEYKGNNNAEDLTKFIILTSGTWLQLAGCVAAFDDLIKDFLNKTADEREKVIEAGTTLLAGWTGSREEEIAART